MKKVEALRRLAFEKKGFDGFLITNEINLLYFTGFPGATFLLIPENGESIIYVHGTNYEQAKAEGEGFRVELVKLGGNLMEEVAAQVKGFRIERLAVDALSFEDYEKLMKGLKDETKVKMQNKLVWELRKVKYAREIELMQKAGELTSEGMKTAYEVIKPHIREYEVAAEIEYTMRKKGSWGTAFETIVASGVRSAFPHGGCTDRKIQKGDLVVVDIGASYQHYRSDMTRTVTAGEPSAKQRKLYKIVKTAQEKAFQAVKPKAKAKEIDGIARKVIEDAGHGEYFVHGLGHGVGLEVHEPPTLSQESRDRVNIGNIVTIEPGIYIVGFGGIRIEDTVIVQKNNAERLTKGLYTLETKQ